MAIIRKEGKRSSSISVISIDVGGRTRSPQVYTSSYAGVKLSSGLTGFLPRPPLKKENLSTPTIKKSNKVE